MQDVAARDPWFRLVTLGWVALALGILDLLRFPANLLLFDFVDAVVAILSGLALLRRRRSALLATAIAGGVILGNLMVSLPLISRTLLRDLGPIEQVENARSMAPVLARFILYGLQFLFWPLASAAAMVDQRARGLPDAYTDHTRDTVIGAFCLSFWMSGVLQALIKIRMFDLV